MVDRLPGGLLTAATVGVTALAAVALLVRLIEPTLAFFPTSGEDVTPRDEGVEFRAESIATSDGEHVRVWHLPHDAPLARVVYFHGNGGNLSMWSPILIDLWKHGFDVVALDYRGYGVSTGRPTEAGLYRDVDATLAYVNDRLARIDAPLVFWGRSLGTAMAAYAASRCPVQGIVLEAGFPSARSVLEANPLLWTLSWLASYRFATADHMRNAPSAHVLVLHGDRDRVIDFRLGERLYGSLRGPKRFVTIRGGGHNDATPADPDTYWTAIRDFARALPASVR